jgi:cellulose synthase/poly-beta-1,6-N-acetylglucosamine synthase-like glycosyltransferase
MSGFSLMLTFAVSLVLLVEALRVLLSLTLAVFAYFAKDPVPMVPQEKLRVAVLTTIVPGKEPFELVAETLMAMKQIETKGNKVDVWLLDEGNDPFIKTECKKMGVKHFSRNGIAKWNQKTGQFRAKTKHGNHNAWRSKHEKSYDIVAQMDPDHVPRKNFLSRTLGYFNDPDVGFVVAPQVYGNLKNNWIARASASQAYVFHGIVQRGGNGMEAPLLIGTNHLYRVKAFKQIKGYQDSIIEDHFTSLVITGTKNHRGNAWKGIYTPDILAVGEGPTSFTDYFNQQKRWAYGIWEIARDHTRGAVKKLTKLQKLTFLMLQFFYPSLAIGWLASSIVIILFGGLVNGGQTLGPVFGALWALSILSCLSLFFWLRRFNLVEHERKDWALNGMALTLMCLPIYFVAGWEALRRKPLSYAVTAKGNLTSPDSLRTFSAHIQWLFFSAFTLIMVLQLTHGTLSSSFDWTIERIALCASPIMLHTASLYRSGQLLHPIRGLINLPRLELPQVNVLGKLTSLSLVGRAE